MTFILLLVGSMLLVSSCASQPERKPVIFELKDPKIMEKQADEATWEDSGFIAGIDLRKGVPPDFKYSDRLAKKNKPFKIYEKKPFGEFDQAIIMTGQNAQGETRIAEVRLLKFHKGGYSKQFENVSVAALDKKFKTRHAEAKDEYGEIKKVWAFGTREEWLALLTLATKPEPGVEISKAAVPMRISNHLRAVAVIPINEGNEHITSVTYATRFLEQVMAPNILKEKSRLNH
jgi:hypothetical protein